MLVNSLICEYFGLQLGMSVCINLRKEVTGFVILSNYNRQLRCTYKAWSLLWNMGYISAYNIPAIAYISLNKDDIP